MLRCAKIAPGMHFKITDSGTLESEQPIHRTCIREREVSRTLLELELLQTKLTLGSWR